jgi:hypothetical protein
MKMKRSSSVCIIRVFRGKHLIRAVSKSPDHCSKSFRPDSKHCRIPDCPWCRRAPLSYPYHLCCYHMILQCLTSQAKPQGPWLLRFAQSMALVPVFQDEQTPTRKSLTYQFQKTYEKLMGILQPRTELAVILPRVRSLPMELQEYIFGFMLSTPGGCALFNSNALFILSTIQWWPEEGHYSVSCKGALFARWVAYSETLHLAGLYDKNVEGSVQIKAEDVTWDHIVVLLDNIGITEVLFIASGSAPNVVNTSSFVQVLRRPKPSHETLWITMEVRITLVTKKKLNILSRACIFPSSIYQKTLIVVYYGKAPSHYHWRTFQISPVSQHMLDVET